MGGLHRSLPITWITMLVAALAISENPTFFWILFQGSKCLRRPIQLAISGFGYWG